MSAQTASMQYAALDCDKVLTFVLRNDTKLQEQSLVYIQFAMLYTDHLDVRRIMVLNYVWKVCSNLVGYFKSADVEAVSQFKIRHMCTQALGLGAKRTKEKLINDVIELLYNYRKNCGQSNNPSQLVLPEMLRLYPLYMLSAIKTPAFRLLSMCKLDEKIAMLYKFVTMGFNQMAVTLYPRIYQIHDFCENLNAEEPLWLNYDSESGQLVKPMLYPCKLQKQFNSEIVLIDDSEYLTILVGSQV